MALRKVPGGPLAEILHFTHDTENHFHTKERWLGAASSPNEVNAADPTSFTAFQLDSGNSDWGTAVPIIGSDDTPISAGEIYFDFHRLLFTNVEQTSLYRIRFAWGNSYAEGISLDNYTELVLLRGVAGNIEVPPLDVRMPKLQAGTKVFGNCKCLENTGTIDFIIGVHEYTN